MSRPARLRDRSRSDDGYVAVLTGLLTTVLLGMAALTVDVGMWYVTGQHVQRAADAGALAGVTSLPGDPANAFARAAEITAANEPDSGEVTVTSELGGSPTRLRVTVSKEVDNLFGGLMGVPTTTVTRTAVADYAGPVPMGSPCNEFGNDPDDTGQRGAACADTGQFWANVGSRSAPKRSGDAFHDGQCSGGDDGCAGGVNLDYDPNGYFYAVTLSRPVSNLSIEAFDAALVDVGDHCERGSLAAAKAIAPADAAVPDPATRYSPEESSPYCTGDIRFGGTGDVATRFTVRGNGTDGDPWDPMSFPVRAGCQTTYPGFAGDLGVALDQSKAGYDPYVAGVFRRWSQLCEIPSAAEGTYLVQVNTDGLGSDAASGHNRFALRAYSTTDPSAKDAIAITGLTKMAVYANLPGAQTQFYLARLPSGAQGHILNVRLFDVGDAASDGQIRVLAPDDSGVVFSNCTGFGPKGGNGGTLLPSCQVTANSSSFQGRWQTIAVPVPESYTCDDSDSTACWVKLSYDYGGGTQTQDTTSWQASLEGDPVRLVE